MVSDTDAAARRSRHGTAAEAVRVGNGRNGVELVDGSRDVQDSNVQDSNVQDSNGQDSNGQDSNVQDSNGQDSNGQDSNGRSRNGARPNGNGRNADAESTEDILRRYRRRKLTTLRDRVVERHRPIVEGMARGLASRLPPTVDAQDLVHAGMWGLMQAIATYEPERCDRFTAFMRIRVRGAMLDELRQMDFLPRLIRRRLRQCEDALLRLRMQLAREPTHEEVAAELGISPQVLVRWQERSAGRALRSDFAAEAVEQLVDEGNESPIEPIARRELLEHVRAALPPLEWKVLRLIYLEGLTGRQVARRLRLSASRICQIHGRVLERLKTQLATLATG